MSLLWCSRDSSRMRVSREWSMWLIARSFRCVGLLCHSKSASLHDTSEEGNSRMMKKRTWIQANSFKTIAKMKRFLWLLVSHRFQSSHLVLGICSFSCLKSVILVPWSFWQSEEANGSLLRIIFLNHKIRRISKESNYFKMTLSRYYKNKLW